MAIADGCGKVFWYIHIVFKYLHRFGCGLYKAYYLIHSASPDVVNYVLITACLSKGGRIGVETPTLLYVDKQACLINKTIIN